MQAWLLAIAVLVVIFIPFVPQLIRLRIRLLKWLHWTWAVNLLESDFQGWVVFFRILLVLIAALLLYLGLSDGLSGER